MAVASVEGGVAGRQGGQDGRVVERVEMPEHQEQGDHEPEVADPVGDERLLGRDRGAVALEPEADQPVGAEPDALPAEEAEQEVVREDQHDHREQEQVHVEKEPPVARVALHVPDRVQRDQAADPGDEEAPDHRERIELQPEVDVEGVDRDPGEDVLVDGAVVGGCGRAG